MDESAGRLLETYVKARWKAIGKGGIRGLCRASGLTPEVVYSWFRGDNEPSLGALRTLAVSLRVERAELVAVMDGYDLSAARRDLVAEEVAAAVAPIRALMRDAGLLPAATTHDAAPHGGRPSAARVA